VLGAAHAGRCSADVEKVERFLRQYSCIGALLFSDRHLHPKAPERRRLVVRVLPGTSITAEGGTHTEAATSNEDAESAEDGQDDSDEESLEEEPVQLIEPARADPPHAATILRDISAVKQFASSSPALEPIRSVVHTLVDVIAS
jgi:hypothetical protein